MPNSTFFTIEGKTKSGNVTKRWSNWTFATSDLVISLREPSARLTGVRTVRTLCGVPTSHETSAGSGVYGCIKYSTLNLYLCNDSARLDL